jgi:hypothetical protein
VREQAPGVRRPWESRSIAVWALCLSALSLVYSAGWLWWASTQGPLFKKRGVDLDPAVLRTKLKLSGAESATLFVTRIGNTRTTLPLLDLEGPDPAVTERPAQRLDIVGQLLAHAEAVHERAASCGRS